MSQSAKERRFELGHEGLPDLAMMMLITLDGLRALGGSATIQELVDYAIEHEHVTEEEQGYLLPNGRDRRLNYYLGWARTYLKRGDAVGNSARGVWALTEKGEHITNRAETFRIYTQVNEEEKERARARRQEEKLKRDRKDEIAETATSPTLAEETWQDELIATLMTLDPGAFERLSQRLLREAGFVKVEVRGKTGDGGIDGVGILRVNLVSFQVYFQCKRWSASIGAKEIRDFRGALQGRADKGLFITTSSFTKQASDEATRDGAIAIDLIDGQRLCQLMKDYDLGVKTEMKEEVSIIKDWLREI